MIRKKACKALARNLACALLENFEVSWQSEVYDISDDETAYMQQELRKIAHKITMTIDFDALGQIKKV